MKCVVARTDKAKEYFKFAAKTADMKFNAGKLLILLFRNKRLKSPEFNHFRKQTINLTLHKVKTTSLTT